MTPKAVCLSSWTRTGNRVIDDKSGGVEYFTIGKTAGEQTPQSDPHELPVGNPDNKLAF